MKLYYGPGLCSQAPHIVARELGIPLELVKVDLASKRTEQGDDYLAINPHGYVPALEIAPGQVLTEGPAIMQYLADLKPAAGLVAPAGTAARYRLQSLLNFITAEVHKTYSALFMDIAEDAKVAFRARLAQRLDSLERVLQARPTLLEEGYSPADAYLYVVTGWSRFVGVDLERWPAIAAQRTRMEQRPAVRAALQAEGLLK